MVFKEESQTIFEFTDDQISRFIATYRDNCLSLFPNGDDLDLLDDSIKTSDFT
jgi:hypothetical protein